MSLPKDLHFAHLDAVTAVDGTGLGEAGGVKADVAGGDEIKGEDAIVLGLRGIVPLHGFDGGKVYAVHRHLNFVILGEHVDTVPYVAGNQFDAVDVVDVQQVDGDPFL